MSLHLTYPQKYPDIFYSKECLFLDAVDGTAAGTARLVDALISLTLLFTVIHIGVNRNDECTENGKLSAQKTVTTVHKNQ